LGKLVSRIRELVAADRYVVGGHAAERLDERAVEEWQILSGLAEGTIRSERPNTVPHPTIEVEQWLADGTAVNVVWALIESIDIAKLVTVHFFDA
jgi:hypothetical protein